jgi:hypothetical protein
MHLGLPLLGVDNGNAVSDSGDNSSTDLCRWHLEEYWVIDEVGESNLRTISITFQDEVVSNLSFAS